MNHSQNLAIPFAIIIAGALIAGAVFYAAKTAAERAPAEVPQEQVSTEIRGVQANDHILGNPNAPVAIIEYSDTECPFCKDFHFTLQRLLEEYGASGEIAWVYRHFPIEQMHPDAPKQAEALECAAELGGNEGFWEYTNRLYEITPSNNGLALAQLPEIAEEVGLNVAQFEACLTSGKHAERVERDMEEAIAAGGRGTPYNVLIIEGEQIPLEGAQPYEVMHGLVEILLDS